MSRWPPKPTRKMIVMTVPPDLAKKMGLTGPQYAGTDAAGRPVVIAPAKPGRKKGR